MAAQKTNMQYENISELYVYIIEELFQSETNVSD